jgi:hypothetical protein
LQACSGEKRIVKQCFNGRGWSSKRAECAGCRRQRVPRAESHWPGWSCPASAALAPDRPFCCLVAVLPTRKSSIRTIGQVEVADACAYNFALAPVQAAACATPAPHGTHPPPHAAAVFSAACLLSHAGVFPLRALHAVAVHAVNAAHAGCSGESNGPSRGPSRGPSSGPSSGGAGYGIGLILFMLDSDPDWDEYV